MLLSPGCIPCIVRQAYNNSRMAEINNSAVQQEILYKIMSLLISDKKIISAHHFSIKLQSVLSKYVDVRKMYRQLKESNLEKAKRYIPYLTHLIEGAADRLEMSIRASIAGNIIDPGPNPNFDLEREINTITSKNINLDAYPKFKEDYKKAKSILFIADNYEEALFDKLLIQQMHSKEIIFAVRSTEILNDITFEDSMKLEINKLCKVIESGSSIAGTDLNQCNDEFINLFENSDLVIAKGQGNLETLLDVKRPVYFMFKVKCEVISELCGYPIGSGALHYNKN